MNIYPDTSFLIALRFFDDVHHISATEYYEEKGEETFLWSPWHRLEVSNTLRQLARGEQPVLREADARRVIHRVETDVRLGYFLHMEADWRDVLRAAGEISAANAFERSCAATDLLHVAYAVELVSDLFVSFDDEQLELARGAGLRVERPR